MSTFDWRSKRVIVVDRDEQFRFWVLGVFRHLRVREAFGLSEVGAARPLLTTQSADVALVELGESDDAALDFLRWLRDRQASSAPDLPVLLLVKSPDRTRLGSACALGIHGVLRKPVSADAMLKAAVGVMTRPQLVGRSGPLPTTPAAAPAAKDKAAVPTRATAEAPAAPPAASAERPQRKSMRGDIEIRSAAEPAQSSGGFLPVDAPEGKAAGGYLEVAGEPAPRRSRGIELRAEAEVAKPLPAPSPDVEAMLAAHALWVSSGGGAGQRLRLEGGDLSRRCLARAELTSALLRRADLSGCDLAEAGLHGADLRDAELLGCNLSAANLAVSRLRRARLRGAVLVGANLKGADLAGADLGGAKLGDAELKGAILLGADLSAADLAAVRGLSQGQLDGARGDAKTRLPPGLRLPSADEDPSLR